MQDKHILALDIGLLMAGAKERGELEARVTSLIKEVQKAGCEDVCFDMSFHMFLSFSFYFFLT